MHFLLNYKNTSIQDAIAVEALAGRHLDGQKDGYARTGEDADHDRDLIFDRGQGIGTAQHNPGHHTRQGDQTHGRHHGGGWGQGGPDGVA